MVKRRLTLRDKTLSEDAADAPAPELADAEHSDPQGPDLEVHGQKRREELGRYWLQIDRQTKGSYASAEAAEAAGMAIKTKFANLQVAIYDRDESSNRILEVPA